MKFGKTARGFSIIDFKDRYDVECNIQESSLATDDAIWIGCANPEPKIMSDKGWVPYKIPEYVLINTRMHLTRRQVKELLPILANFVETGDVELIPEQKREENSK